MDSDHQKIGLPSVSLRQLHYALAAADSGNVTEAAKKLHVSQPAISAAIAVLERHYGTALFTR
ncbi:MAG TPA: LysR family transcriptional regulator, partial [Aestuariivirga sp.]|nr:LysR family transcriptional regulator [Aestuariivirga sp.]